MPNSNGPMRDPNMFSGPSADPALLQTALSGPSDQSTQAAQQYNQQVQAWAASSAAMKTAATSGHFAVDPVAGQKYVDLYNFCLEQLPGLKTKVDVVTSEYKLGTSPGAKLVAPSNLMCAQQLEAAFNQLESVYTNARDAYAAAMKNYKENDESVTFTMQQLTGKE
jgi:hypothetical protein